MDKNKIMKAFCERDCATCASFKRECKGCPVLKGNLYWMAAADSATAEADSKALKGNNKS